jgi:hypothetical protein
VHIPIAILKHRTILRDNKHVPQVLIQWSDLALEDASWEDMGALDTSRLADKSLFQGEGMLCLLRSTHTDHVSSYMILQLRNTTSYLSIIRNCIS